MVSTVKKFLNDDSGATAIEYGLLAGLIAVVIITAVTSVGTRLSNVFATVNSELGTAQSNMKPGG